MITTHDDIDETVKNAKEKNHPEPKIHPWRLCPIGKHFIKEHIVHTRPSKKHPEGTTKKIHDHCATNPSKKVTVWYDKGIYDSYDKVMRRDPHISIQDTSTIMHVYEPRRNFSIAYAKEKVATWKRLMKNEKYICIGGAFAGTRKKNVNGKEITEHGWVYENVKTKKGCDSYFSGFCH